MAASSASTWKMGSPETRFINPVSSFGSDGSHPSVGFRLLQGEVVTNDIERRIDGLAGRRLAARGQVLEIDDQRRLHAVHDIAFYVLAAALEKMGDQAMMSRRLDQEMDVRGAHMADIGLVHQLAHGPVHGDGITDG